ncbi:RES domain-containing protein [Thalassotalea euphylliae]|uniref:RES domain-containing protein n=1 Tax=Thalassotalea euphylliae TaxID=1655234 RepID=A0A3E0TTF9_9GAMM|nr:RES domain-containing protein [Thalassotalea euphylliae]REL27753.1 RES domain-containing protein [Thalassotalea euphylliae]
MNELPIYRIIKKKWVENAFDGEGARRFGGRWNSKGQGCVYVASSESLALLELLVHFHAKTVLSNYAVIKSYLDKEHVMTLGVLPENWRSEPAPPQTARVGDQWLASEQSLALMVPSVIVLREFNYLLNPAHPAMQSIIDSAQTLNLSIDPRLVETKTSR